MEGFVCACADIAGLRKVERMDIDGLSRMESVTLVSSRRHLKSQLR